MKRFLVFSGDHYYPSGGWKDFRGSYAILEEAKASEPGGDWAHIIDTESGLVVAVSWWIENVQCPKCKNMTCGKAIAYRRWCLWCQSWFSVVKNE